MHPDARCSSRVALHFIAVPGATWHTPEIDKLLSNVLSLLVEVDGDHRDIATAKA